MKKFLKTLVVGLCLFTLLCCALPAAFAADKTSGSKKEENVKFCLQQMQPAEPVRQTGEHA